MDKITKAMITEWSHHPISKGFIKLVTDFKDANKSHLQGLIMNAPLGKQIEVVAQLKGQILALEEVLNTKEFLYELVEQSQEQEKRENEKSQSNRSENFIEGQEIQG